MTQPVIWDKQKFLSRLLPGGNEPPSTTGATSAPAAASIPSLEMPAVLEKFLIDLRLLRHVPLSYLVPDPALLPPESVRFFHVDPTFTDRLVDGALAAANIGTLDQGYSKAISGYVRTFLDRKLEEQAGLPKGSWPSVAVTGMLLRSVLVRRWPGLTVRAFGKYPADPKVEAAKQPLVTLRLEQLAPSILLVLFAGLPAAVEVREPDEGTRFGVEGVRAALPPGLTVQPRSDDDKQLAALSVPLRDTQLAVLNTLALSSLIKQKLPGVDIDSSRLALSLQQAPFVQIFRGVGSDPASAVPTDAIKQLRADDLGKVQKLGGV